MRQVPPSSHPSRPHCPNLRLSGLNSSVPSFKVLSAFVWAILWIKWIQQSITCLICVLFADRYASSKRGYDVWAAWGLVLHGLPWWRQGINQHCGRAELSPRAFSSAIIEPHVDKCLAWGCCTISIVFLLLNVICRVGSRFLETSIWFGLAVMVVVYMLPYHAFSLFSPSSLRWWMVHIDVHPEWYLTQPQKPKAKDRQDQSF